MIYVHPNGIVYGIDVKTHDIVKCGPVPRSPVVCIQPKNANDVLKTMQEKLGWILDMAAGCSNNPPINPHVYWFFYMVDAYNGQVISLSTGLPNAPITC